MEQEYKNTQRFQTRNVQYVAGSGIVFTPQPDKGVTEISTQYGGGAFTQVGHNLEDVDSPTETPYVQKSGFEDRTSTTLAYASGTFTLTYVSDATVWFNGIKHILIANKTVALGSDRTLYYVYLDEDMTLTASTDVWTWGARTFVPVALVYRLDANTAAIGDERHGALANNEFRAWGHCTLGARYDATTGGLTGTFGATTFTITAGAIWDEDIKLTIAEATTCRRWYRYTGGASMTFADNQTTLYSLNGSNIQYDNNGTLTNAQANRYVNHYVYATNDTQKPIYSLIGQAEYTTLANARDESNPGFANISGREWKLLYRVTYQNTGSPPTYVEALDYRSIGGIGTIYAPTDHGGLTGLQDDDHIQYVLHTEVDDTPVDGADTDPISSNWAYDHVAAADPHTGYRLESADHDHSATGLQAGQLDWDTCFSDAAHDHSSAAEGGAVDAGVITYTPAVLTDWDGDADPGDTNDALDQLAERVDDLEIAPPSHVHDAADVTFTPTVLTDWDSDTDPGDVDNALDQLAERVDDLEIAPPAHVHDAADVTYTPAVATDWDGDADPGDVDNALDQLAERVDDLEGAGGHDAVTLAADADVLLSLSTQEIGLDTQTANTVLAGPTSGAAADPTFRALVTADIPDEAVTYAKMQHVSATDKVLGRATAGAGDVEEIACTSAGRALLDDATAAAQRTTLDVTRFVDRGDPSARDKTTADFTADATWNDLDLSAVVPAGAVAIIFRILIQNTGVNHYIRFRKNGNSNTFAAPILYTQVANNVVEAIYTIACDSGRVIEYYLTTGGTWSDIGLVVTGWFV